MTGLVLWVSEETVGLRVSVGDQVIGLDASDIGERAYVGVQEEELAT
jgi:ammonia channel protein AmtB